MNARRRVLENVDVRTRSQRRGRGRPLPSRRSGANSTFLVRSRGVNAHLRRAPSGPQSLRQLAALYGIQDSYIDMDGKRQHAGPDTLKALLEIFEVSAGNAREVRDAIRQSEKRKWRQVLQPVVVAWDGKPTDLLLRVPAPHENVWTAELRLEDGSSRRLPAEYKTNHVLEAADIDGRSYTARRFRLPPLPFGYHQLDLELNKRLHRALIISAPTKSYSPAQPKRLWGFFAPTYALHSHLSWGAGSLGDLQRLADWSAQMGARVLSTLPLLAAFLDSPACEPSPYSPVSRLFWNEFYIDIPAVPEFSASAEAQRVFHSLSFQESLADFRQNGLIDYREQMKARRRVLEPMAKRVVTDSSPRRMQFEAFVEKHPRVKDYACFRAACDHTRIAWHRWEPRMRHGKLQTGDYATADVGYHLYAQWLAHEQMSNLANFCRSRSLRLCLDMPLGVSSDGYDLWREPDSFASSVTAGAPPDPVFSTGQDWGFAPLHPMRIRQRAFAYVLENLRFQMRHAGMLRIDHILGLHRMYLIPRGFSPRKGAYVTYPAEELQAMLSLESHRHRTVLVGENLGTVPPQLESAMRRHGFRETYVLQYEQRTDAQRPFRHPPRLSVASLNTHDMPPFVAQCRGLDIDDRADLGLVQPDQLHTQHKKRRALCAAARKFLKARGILPPAKTDEMHLVQACLDWLARSPSETVLINLEDLWGETEPQNVPGTSVERPNWRRLFRLSLDEIAASKEFKEFLLQINARRKKLSRGRLEVRRAPTSGRSPRDWQCP